MVVWCSVVYCEVWCGGVVVWCSVLYCEVRCGDVVWCIVL